MRTERKLHLFRLRTHLVAFLIVGLLPTSLPAAQWPKNETAPGTLGERLERRFSSFRAGCRLKLKDKAKDDAKLSSIPPDARRRFSLDRPVTGWEGRNAQALLSYVFPREDLTVPMLDPARQILAYVGPEDTPVPDGTLTSRHVFSETCVTLARAAVDAEVKGLPFLTVKAAARSENQVNGVLVVAEGRFKSPLYARLTERGPSALAAYLSVWEHYDAHPELLRSGQGRKFISTFEGVALYDRMSTDNLGAVGGEAGVDVGWMIASLRGDALLSRETISRLRSVAFDTFVFLQPDDSTPSLTWAELPMPGEIAKRLAEVVPTASAPDPLAAVGIPVPVVRQVAGIPASLCDDSRWRLRVLAGNITAPQVQSADGACVFSVRFTAASSSDSLVARYYFAEINPVGGDSLKLFFQPRLQWTNQPEPRIGQYFDRLAVARRQPLTGHVRLEWTLPVEFDDEQEPVDYLASGVDGAHGEMTCDDGEGAIALDVFEISRDAAKRQFIYRISRAVPPGEEISANPSELTVCTLELALQLPLAHRAGVAEKTLVVRDVVMPRVRPVAPTLPAPGP